MTYQVIIIIGNVGRDPEMRYTPTGQAVTHFSVATNREYTGNTGEKVKETTWFNISAWGRTGEVCNEYLKKGSKVLVEGRITPDKNGNPRIWTGQDGSARSSYEVSAQTVRFLSSRSEVEQNGAQEYGDQTAGTVDANYPAVVTNTAPLVAPPEPEAPPVAPEDDIPF